MKLIPAVLVSLALVACAVPSAPPSPTPTAPAGGIAASADRVVLSAERGFAVAEIAYTVAADGTARLVRAGLIRGETARRLRVLNGRARTVLVTGKATADGARRAAAAAELLAIATQIDLLKGR